MGEMYRYYLQKYLEKMTNLESHLLVLQDKNKLLDDIKDIELYLYPYKVIFANYKVYILAFSQCPDQRRHFNGIRPRSENR
jgi:hypothetical protein